MSNSYSDYELEYIYISIIYPGFFLLLILFYNHLLDNLKLRIRVATYTVIMF